MAGGPSAFHPSLGWSSGANEAWAGRASSCTDLWCALKQDMHPTGLRGPGNECALAPRGCCSDVVLVALGLSDGDIPLVASFLISGC